MSPDHTLSKMFSKTVVNPFIAASEFAEQFYIRETLFNNQSLRLTSDNEASVHEHLRGEIFNKGRNDQNRKLFGTIVY